MLRSLLMFTGCCSLAGSLQAQLEFEKPIREFYRSPQDKLVEARFPFKNVGKTPVKVENVRTSCGCTTADLERKVYAPGEQGELSVKFSFGSRVGPQRKTVRVFTDDRGNEPTVLDLRVFIEEPLTITPALVFWRVGEASGAKSVAITAKPERPVRVVKVTSSNPRVTASLQTIKAGEQYSVNIKPGYTAARESAEISIQTDFPPDAPRTYTVHARIK